ncbi:MAG: site-specific integrase [Gammaproteobacteria bacterium]|nr:site-specific integrase [Gammaproteobacteria bacterium]MCW5582982.1 site-specific integrase [Gammaproteobacteria bacterium]
MANEYIPVPLFDTLEYLDVPLDTQLSHIKAQLPNNIAINDVYADYKHACSFLHAYRGSTETFKSYRREIERLLQWSWFLQTKTLKDLRRNDLEIFLEFCQAPPKHWIGIKHVPRFIDKNGLRVANPVWRPFVATISKKAHRDGKLPNTKSYTLSQSALQAIFAILSSLFNYLEQEDYTFGNPISQIRQKSKFLRKHHGKKIIRRLSELQWAYTIETAELLTNENPLLHERTLFIMNALFAMYLRISELAANKRWIPQMGHFYKDKDSNWWFKTVGKGNKERDISVSNAMLEALKRYRISLGLSSLPSPGETIPLIPKTLGKGPVEGVRHIRKIVQYCFDKTIARLKTDGFKEDAETLMAATAHWLRHTGISEDVKIRPREHVRDDAGHSSSAITDQYIDIELRARHASAKKKRIKFKEKTN